MEEGRARRRVCFRRYELVATATTAEPAGVTTYPCVAAGVLKCSADPSPRLYMTAPESGSSAYSVAESTSIAHTAPPDTIGDPM